MTSARDKTDFERAGRGVTALGDEFDLSPNGESERGIFVNAVGQLFAGLARTESLKDFAEHALDFASANASCLGIAHLAGQLAEFDYDDASRVQRRCMIKQVAQSLRQQQVKNDSALTRRINFLGDLLALDQVERHVISILARRAGFTTWQQLLDQNIFGEDEKIAALAMITGLPNQVILRAVSPSNTLRTRGFFRSNKSRWDLDLSDFVTRFFRSSATTESEMLNALMPVLPRSSLQIDDFEHMRTQLEMAQRLLEHGIATGQRANLLLYGVPGTGKSEFGRLLADQLGTTAVSIGETDDDGEEPDRGDRLLHLTVARKLVEQRHSAILLIDEAEDLFLSDTRSKGSKLWLNKLVEDGAGPHIWIVNDPGLLGEPVIRRMDMAIEFAVPPPAARRRIVEQAFARMANAGSSVAPSMVCQLTNELTGLNTSPAIVSAAIRTAERIGGTENCVAIARALAKASGRRGQDDLRLGHIAFDPGLSSANFDLKTLAGRLAETDMNWSLLLSGPPGTGKSAYAHFLAQKAGIDLISVSGADLLGPFVGQTEERISEVFARAEQGGSLLLIDEADSFLGNRDQAGQNWEVSMTNEMLRQMERGRARFIATTNRADTLDPASARRFALHVAFKPMSVEKSNMMFEETFGIVAPASFSKIVGLTPGDFAQAKNRAALMNETNSQTLVSWLADAVNARDGMRVKVGF